jgi:predicted regulator of Ras-like GTPase activity (Roadblock/LC7/MglB family)
MPFRRILSSLIERAPGARGAIFCDYEGEFVDLALSDPQLSEYELKVFGAQMAAAWINLHDGATTRGAGGIEEMRLGCEGGTLLCRALPDGYYVVLVLQPRSPSGAASFELARSSRELAAEL